MSWLDEFNEQINHPNNLYCKDGFVLFKPRIKNSFEKYQETPAGPTISPVQQDTEIAKDKAELEKKDQETIKRKLPSEIQGIPPKKRKTYRDIFA